MGREKKREIIFRAWNEKRRKFYYFKDGRYFKNLELKNCIPDRLYSGEFNWENKEQYININTKDNVMIFENDIIDKYWNHLFIIEHNIKDGYEAGHGYNEVVKKSGFEFKFDSVDFKVVGNIHETPELIKDAR